MFKIDFNILCMVFFSITLLISCAREEDTPIIRSDLTNLRSDALSHSLPNTPLSPSGTLQPMMLVPPPSGGAGDKFSKKCQNPKIDGFLLTAKCRDNSNNTVNSSKDFSNCIKNYDGNLRLYDGRDSELYSYDCDLNPAETRIRCKCQQPTGGFKSCYIKLDDVFKVVNGELKC
jgi:hypothetical protein